MGSNPISRANAKTGYLLWYPVCVLRSEEANHFDSVRDLKVSTADSRQQAGRRERGQAERGVTATSERLTKSRFTLRLRIDP